MSSRAALQTVHLLTGEKTLVLDPKQVADDTLLLTVVAWGEVLPKGAKPTADHVHRLKPAYRKDRAEKKVYKMTRNEAGKFKHYWDTEKDGVKPVKPRKKRAVPAPATAVADDDGGVHVVEEAEKPAKKKKQKVVDTTKRSPGEMAVNQARIELNAAVKKMDALVNKKPKAKK